MAELGDLMKEWRDAKPPEKLLIVGISVAAVGIAIYIHSKTSSTASATPTNPVGGTAGAPGTIATGGTPSNGQPVAPGTPTPPTGTKTPAPVHLPVVDPPIKTPVKTPTGTKTPAPVKRITPVMVAHPVAHGTVVTRVAAQSHPNVYHPIYPSRQLVISHIQSMPTRPNDYAPHVTQPPAPINPTKQQVITHLQNQRRMP